LQGFQPIRMHNLFCLTTYQTRRWVQGLQVFNMHALIEGSDIIVAFCEIDTQQLVGFARV